MKKTVLFGGVTGIKQTDVEKMKQYIHEEYPEADFIFYGEQSLPADQLIEVAKEADILISWDQEMDDLTYQALNLKAYLAASVGYNAANVDAASRHGVYVANVPGYCTEEVASHTVAFILSLYRQMYILNDYVKAGQWDLEPLKEITRFEDSTVGLLGFGRIGRAVARKLTGFKVRVIANDPVVSEQQMQEYGVEKVGFTELLNKSDYLSLHVPLLDSTRQIINQDAIAQMKDGAYLINTARGSLIDEEALYQALTSGKLRAAALDVLADEPPSDMGKRLISLPNTQVTCHSAYLSNEASDLQIRLTAKNVATILSGHLPESTINPLCRGEQNELLSRDNQ